LCAELSLSGGSKLAGKFMKRLDEICWLAPFRCSLLAPSIGDPDNVITASAHAAPFR
jgi:hypothetical protein